MPAPNMRRLGCAHDDGEGDAEVVQHAPISLQLLLVAQFRQAPLIARLGARGRGDIVAVHDEQE